MRGGGVASARSFLISGVVMKETSFQKTALAVSFLSVFSFGVQANPLGN